MKKLLISQNIHWEKRYENLYDRDVLSTLIQRLELKQIEAIQGIRRSGKSSLFKLLINHLSRRVNPLEILYINLDDPFFVPYSKEHTKLYKIVEMAEQITGVNVKYLFLDEVQSIFGWERFVKSVYDNEVFKKIFVTGSNATFLDGELAKLLTGRYFSTKVYPLSFSEILKINNIDGFLQLLQERAKVLKIVQNLIHYGSFVEVYESEEAFKRDIIKSYYETILLKDCVANNNLRDIKSFRELSFYLLTNNTLLYSYNSLSKAVGITDVSAKEYISYLEDSFLLSEIKQFSYSLKEQNSSKKKVYFHDNGFLTLNFSFSKNLGANFENLVFSELIKDGWEVFFYNKNFECDFIVKKDAKIVAIQVCYELNDRNLKREVNGLKKLPFDCNEKYLITYEQSMDIDGIKVVPFYEFFAKRG